MPVTHIRVENFKSIKRCDIDLNNIKMQEDEVSEVKYVTLNELNKIIENKEFVPTITPSLNMFLAYINMIKE